LRITGGAETRSMRAAFVPMRRLEIAAEASNLWNALSGAV
jgi:hypothetical protein